MIRIIPHKKILLTAWFFMFGLNVHALEYELEANLGFDSSPFEFADAFTPESDQYLELDMRLRQEIAEGLRVTATLQNQSYFDQSDADDLKTAVKLDYSLKSQLMQRDVRYRVDVEYNLADSVYVSKNLGRIGETSLGVPVPDRYDATWLDYRARADIELTDSVRLDLNLVGRSKNYEDLSSAGLSSLDYSQWLFEPELRYSSNEQNLLTAKTTIGTRSYDTRNGRDLSGVFVPNTQLEYDYLGVKLGWRYRPRDSQQFRVTYNYEARKDNVSGYFDATDNLLSLGYRTYLTDKHMLRLGLRYKDFSYDNTVTVSLIEEPLYTKNGFDLSASYGYLWSQTPYGNWWLNTRVGYEDYDSVNASFAYDRSLFSVGIKLEL